MSFISMCIFVIFVTYIGCKAGHHHYDCNFGNKTICSWELDDKDNLCWLFWGNCNGDCYACIQKTNRNGNQEARLPSPITLQNNTKCVTVWYRLTKCTPLYVYLISHDSCEFTTLYTTQGPKWESINIQMKSNYRIVFEGKIRSTGHNCIDKVFISNGFCRGVPRPLEKCKLTPPVPIKCTEIRTTGIPYPELQITEAEGSGITRSDEIKGQTTITPVITTVNGHTQPEGSGIENKTTLMKSTEKGTSLTSNVIDYLFTSTKKVSVPGSVASTSTTKDLRNRTIKTNVNDTVSSALTSPGPITSKSTIYSSPDAALVENQTSLKSASSVDVTTFPAPGTTKSTTPTKIVTSQSTKSPGLATAKTTSNTTIVNSTVYQDSAENTTSLNPISEENTTFPGPTHIKTTKMPDSNYNSVSNENIRSTTDIGHMLNTVLTSPYSNPTTSMNTAGTRSTRDVSSAVSHARSRATTDMDNNLNSTLTSAIRFYSTIIHTSESNDLYNGKDVSSSNNFTRTSSTPQVGDVSNAALKSVSPNTITTITTPKIGETHSTKGVSTLTVDTYNDYITRQQTDSTLSIVLSKKYPKSTAHDVEYVKGISTTIEPRPNTKTVKICKCPCRLKQKIDLWKNKSYQDLQRKLVPKRVKEHIAVLQLNTSTLTSKLNKKRCAHDDRPSSKSIGALGIVILLFFLFVLVAFDMISFCQTKSRKKGRKKE